MRTLLVVSAMALFALPAATAKTIYLSAARLTYPELVGTQIDSCALCHSSGDSRNPFGSDFESNNHNFQAIEDEDSDNDGFSNAVEIDALTWPGNPLSYPIVVGTVKVKKPNSEVTWAIGTKPVVAWSFSGDVGPDVTIELWRNDQKVKTLKAVAPNDGKQKVKLKKTLPTGTGFTIKVKSISNPSISDESNATFTIAGAGP